MNPRRFPVALFVVVLIAPSAFSMSNSKAATAAASAGWQPLTNVPQSINPGLMMLLTDGSVLVQDQGPQNSGTGDWWKLTPNSSGGYLNGT